VAPHKDRVAVAGVGYSTIARHSDLSDNALAAQAAQAAMADAGLRPTDIDGVATMGGEALEQAWMLGIEPLGWFSSGIVAPAFVYAALQSIAAIKAGFCHTCIAFRIMRRAFTAQGPRTATIGGDRQFIVPFGAGGAVQWAGLLTRRHMAEYGTTEGQFAAHVMAQRRYAQLNEDAFFRDPLTVEDYFQSRYVSKPVRLLDCDYPCDSGSAVIFTTEERARDLRKSPVLVEAYALSAIQDLNFEILEDMTRTSPVDCARQLWSRTDLRPADVDCAQLYDGFTIITFQWLEALGFCQPGEAGPFVEEGNTGPGGRLPVNTDGGACNVGRRHGANFCIEATRQLRGEGGQRQVPNAEVSIFTNAVGPFSGAVLLTRG
jgi:acetyl-CoA acetyltransferase